MSTAEAFSDLIDELRKGGDLETLAGEIAADYGVNPAFLIRKFHEVYPEGLGPVNPELAEELMNKHLDRQAERFRTEAQAIVDFFQLHPHYAVGLPKEAHKIIRSCERSLRD